MERRISPIFVFCMLNNTKRLNSTFLYAAYSPGAILQTPSGYCISSEGPKGCLLLMWFSCIIWWWKRTLKLPNFRLRYGYVHCVSKKCPQIWLAIGLTNIHQLLAYVISRYSKIGCRYNFPKYLAFTYFIMLWSEMTEMTRYPRHCYSVTGALCKHGF